MFGVLTTKLRGALLSPRWITYSKSHDSGWASTSQAFSPKKLSTHQYNYVEYATLFKKYIEICVLHRISMDTENLSFRSINDNVIDSTECD